LKLDKLTIFGMDVTIDQAANSAKVDGAGAMQMLSNAKLNGEAAEKAVPLEVWWSKEMFFNGRHAEFIGGVQADQEGGHLTCNELQVSFDRPISLKEGNNGDKPARVQKLVCNDNVILHERVMDGDKELKYQRLSVPSLEVIELEPDIAPDADGKPAPAGKQRVSEGNAVSSGGRGELRVFQRAAADSAASPLGGPPKKTPPSKPEGPDPMKMTLVTFGKGGMRANSKTRKASFFGGVRVLNMPCEDTKNAKELDELLKESPPGYMYLSGDTLQVFQDAHAGKPPADDKPPAVAYTQRMVAKDHVAVEAEKYRGLADELYFDEAKDQIILLATGANLAELYKIKQKGGKPQQIKGRKITYIRSTGAFKIDDGDLITGD
jgi:hypothetical protein